MANLAALRAAVLSLSAKNLTGGGGEINPPPPVRGLRVRSESDEYSPSLMNLLRSERHFTATFSNMA